MSTEFEPLEAVRKNFRVVWYRCPIDRSELRQLTRRSDVQGLYQAVGHLALLTGTGVLTYYFFTQRIWIGFALALFAHGTVGSFLRGLAVHELGHGTVFQTKWLNRFFLRLYSLLGWWDFYEYAMSHTYHHRYTLHPRGDREVVLPREPSLNVLYMLQLFTFNVFGGPESTGLVPVLRETIGTALGKFDSDWLEDLYAGHVEERKQAVRWARIVLLFHLGVIVVSTLCQLWLLPVLTSCSIFIANWLKYFVGLPMHCGLRDNVSDFRLCVRSITLDPLSEFLYWRMNWHTEHHMFASVPSYNLKKLHRAVAHDMPQPRTLVGAWREMRHTWKMQRTDPSYQYDTPLPEPVGDPQIEHDPLSFSLGELAPEVLE